MDLEVGMRVKFDGDRKWWHVRATDGERFTILTRQADFQPKGTSFYTIIDEKRALRGPCNLIGQGWEIEAPNGVLDLMRALRGEDPDLSYVEVSHRNNVPILIREVR